MSNHRSSLTDLTVALNSSSYRILSGYLVALFLIGALLSALPLVLHWHERDRFEVAYQKQAVYLSEKYGIEAAFADKYHCYLNFVHYRNQTVFHELLPLLPYVECTTATFEADMAKLRATHSPAHWALVFPGIALMALAIIGWLGLLELNNKNRGSL